MTDPNIPTAVDPRMVLALPMGPNDAEAATIGDYLIELLATLVRDGAGFNSKRPFGTSSWEFEMYAPLVRAGLVRGGFDEDGYIDDVDSQAADRLLVAAVRALWPMAVTS